MNYFLRTLLLTGALLTGVSQIDATPFPRVTHQAASNTLTIKILNIKEALSNKLTDYKNHLAKWLHDLNLECDDEDDENDEFFGIDLDEEDEEEDENGPMALINVLIVMMEITSKIIK
jgi:hypothetical protein